MAEPSHLGWDEKIHHGDTEGTEGLGLSSFAKPTGAGGIRAIAWPSARAGWRGRKRPQGASRPAKQDREGTEMCVIPLKGSRLRDISVGSVSPWWVILN